MVCPEVRETGRGMSRWGPSGRPDGHPAGRLLDRSDLTVFPWTRGCGRCLMRVQETRARSRMVMVTLIREIPAVEGWRCLRSLRWQKGDNGGFPGQCCGCWHHGLHSAMAAPQAPEPIEYKLGGFP